MRGFVPRGLVLRLGMPIAAAVSLTSVYIFFQGRDSEPIVLPLAAILAGAALFYYVLWMREGAAPFFTVGGLAGAMPVLYCAYPLIIFWVNGLRAGPQSDYRLNVGHATPEQLGALAWWYVVYFAVFASTYLLTARGSGAIRLDTTSTPRGIVILIIVVFVSIQIFAMVVGYFFDLTASTYLETYLVIARLPTFVRQLYTHSEGMVPTLEILLLTVLFAHYRQRRVWIGAILGWIVATSFLHIGARIAVVMSLITAGCLYHHLVRRIPASLTVLGGIVLLIGTTWMGVVRAKAAQPSAEELLGTSEFETIMANAYDFRYLENGSGILRDKPGIYFGDFVSIIPQQFLPFAKSDKSGWYLTTYYPAVAAAGGGLAFGVVAEAITGWGWTDLILRGTLVGLLFGWIHRRFTTRPISIWELAFYIWLLVWSYQLIRNTTFCYLPMLEYHFLAPVFGIRLVHYAISSARVRSRTHVSPNVGSRRTA